MVCEGVDGASISRRRPGRRSPPPFAMGDLRVVCRVRSPRVDALAADVGAGGERRRAQPPAPVRTLPFDYGYLGVTCRHEPDGGVTWASGEQA